jgi:hypothetical protein
MASRYGSQKLGDEDGLGWAAGVVVSSDVRCWQSGVTCGSELAGFADSDWLPAWSGPFLRVRSRGSPDRLDWPVLKGLGRAVAAGFL